MSYIMPSRERIQKMSKNEAVRESMKKWMAIAEGREEDHGDENCALCVKYGGLTDETDGCPKCPLDQADMNCNKKGSPWIAYRTGLYNRISYKYEQILALNMWLALALCLTTKKETSR